MTELYLTKGEIRIRREPSAPDQRGTTAPYAIHQALADLFGEYHERPFLYRADGDGSKRGLLILSTTPLATPVPPRSRTLVEVAALATKRYGLGVAPGTVLDYEIRVNATRDMPTKERTRSRRVDAWEAVWQADKRTERTQHEVYGEYLQRKLTDCTRVLTCHVTERVFVRARKRLSGPPAITFVATNLIGALEVLDTPALLKAIGEGIGRSRAFGCGLLCLSRPGTVLPRRHQAIVNRR